MADEAKAAFLQDPPFPTSPRPEDGTLAVDENSTEVWFWNDVAGAWQRTLRGTT